MSVTSKPGKVTIRFGKHQVTLDSEKASKLGLAILDAAKKAGNPK